MSPWSATRIRARPRSVSAMLYTAGATQRLGRVDEGNTITDYDEEEIARADVDLRRHRRTSSGTRPRSISSTRPASTCSSTRPRWPAGGRIRSGRGRWGQRRGGGHRARLELCRQSSTCRASSLPAAWTATAPTSTASWNRLTAAFGRTRGSGAVAHRQREEFERRGRPGEDEGLHVRDGRQRQRQRRSTFPPNLAEAAKTAHERLVELVAEGNDALMEEFFDKGTIPEEHLIAGSARCHPRGQDLPRPLRFRPGQYRHRPTAGLHRGLPADRRPSVAHVHGRADAEQRRSAERNVSDTSRFRCMSSRPSTILSPDASPSSKCSPAC